METLHAIVGAFRAKQARDRRGIGTGVGRQHRELLHCIYPCIGRSMSDLDHPSSFVHGFGDVLATTAYVGAGIGAGTF